MHTYKELTKFLDDLEIEKIPHTGKNYFGHLVAVYHDLKAWGCDEELCRAGMFHSIYGTQQFQGFKLPLESRPQIREMIGERGERLAYWNCAMFRPSFDAAVEQGHGPYRIVDRLTNEEVELTPEDFDDLCRVHLCDWLEQAPRVKKWDYRRDAYRLMAERLRGVALTTYERVYAEAPEAAGNVHEKGAGAG
jgi:hypothetical protein